MPGPLKVTIHCVLPEPATGAPQTALTASVFGAFPAIDGDAGRVVGDREGAGAERDGFVEGDQDLLDDGILSGQAEGVALAVGVSGRSAVDDHRGHGGGHSRRLTTWVTGVAELLLPALVASPL